MKLWTGQMSKFRKCIELEIPYLDTTVKTGNKAFAPSWDFLMKYKEDKDEQAYIDKFIPKMRQSYLDNRGDWDWLLSQAEVCILCYCSKDKFCHRKLLVDIIEKVCKHRGIVFEYKGELL